MICVVLHLRGVGGGKQAGGPGSDERAGEAGFSAGGTRRRASAPVVRLGTTMTGMVGTGPEGEQGGGLCGMLTAVCAAPSMIA